MSSFLLKSVRGGIAEWRNKGLSGSFNKGSKSLNIRREEDTMYCQQALVDEVDALITDLIVERVPASDGYIYEFGKTGRIYRRASNGTRTLVYTDTNGEIRGAAEAYDDTGKTWLYWATPTKLGRKQLFVNTDWSDVTPAWKTDLTDSQHMMGWITGNLLICNGGDLALVGYDGSYTNSTLDFSSKYNLQAVLERGAWVITGAKRTGDEPFSNLFVWDNAGSIRPNDNKPIPAGGLNALIDAGLPLAQVGTDGEIYLSDAASQFLNTPQVTIPGGGHCIHSGVANDKGLALFAIFGNSEGNNGIYSYGKQTKNGDIVLNFEYPIDCDELGALTKTATDLFVSYRDGTDFGVKKVDTTKKATFYYYSLELSLPPQGTDMPELGQIILNTMPLPASCAIEVWYRLDKNTEAEGTTDGWIQAQLQSDTGTEVLQFTTEGGQEAVFLTGESAKIVEVLIVGIPHNNDSPEVNTAEVFFE